jgi:hypothetical protein
MLRPFLVSTVLRGKSHPIEFSMTLLCCTSARTECPWMQCLPRTSSSGLRTKPPRESPKSIPPSYSAVCRCRRPLHAPQGLFNCRYIYSNDKYYQIGEICALLQQNRSCIGRLPLSHGMFQSKPPLRIISCNTRPNSNTTMAKNTQQRVVWWRCA